MDSLRVRHIFITIIVVIVTAYSIVVLFSRGDVPRKPYTVPSAIVFPFLFTEKTATPQQPLDLLTLKHDAAASPTLSAPAYIGIYTAPDGQERVLTEKRASDEHLTASVTKLMTGLVASEVFENSQDITIRKEAILPEGSSGKFLGGEKFSVDTLLHMLFIESNNDAAEALAIAYGRELFIRRMNEKARAVIIQAPKESMKLQHSYIGPEHIFLALLKEKLNNASLVLLSLGVNLEVLKGVIVSILPKGKDCPTTYRTFNTLAKVVIEQTQREARIWSDGTIGKYNRGIARKISLLKHEGAI